MTFLAPILLAFTALGAVPVIIHLLTRRRFRVVTWAAMDFLLATVRRSQRRVQFRDLVLMLLRAAALVLLAVAAARPTVLGGVLRAFAGGAEVSAVVVLDDSMSMQHATAGGSRFEAARRMAAEAVESLPAGSAAAVLASDVARDVVGEPSHDLAFVAGQTRQATAGDGGTDLAAGLRRAWEVLKRRPGAEREVYLATDMQAVGWPAADNADFRRLLDEMNAAKPRPRLVVLDAGDGRVTNVSLEALRCSDELATAGETVRVDATVRRRGPDAGREVTVECYLAEGGREDRLIGARVVGRGDERAGVRFDITCRTAGPARVTLKAAADALPADNAARAVIDVVDRLAVLVVDGAEADAGEAEFLRAALAAAGEDAAGRIAPEVAGRYQLPGLAPEKYPVVVLSDVAELPADWARRLARHVREGAGLIVFAGQRTNGAAYAEALGADLLPAQIGPPLPSDEAAPVRLATAVLEHPLVRFFDAPDLRHYLAAPAFRTRRALLPAAGDGASRPQVVLSFEDGRPAAMERAAGRGRVLVFGFDAGRGWSDLPLHPAWLMLVRRAVQHVAYADRHRRTVQVNEPLVAAVPVSRASAGAEVVLPDGTSRPVVPEPGGGGEGSVLRFAETRRAGFYRLAGADGGQPQATFAANPPAAESDLTALTEGELRARHPELDFRLVGPGDDVARAIRRLRAGSEVWLHLLVLAGLCLLAEQFLAARWAPRDV